MCMCMCVREVPVLPNMELEKKRNDLLLYNFLLANLGSYSSLCLLTRFPFTASLSYQNCL